MDFPEKKFIFREGSKSRRASENRIQVFSMEDTALVCWENFRKIFGKFSDQVLRSYLNERLAEIEELNEEVVRIKAEAE